MQPPPVGQRARPQVEIVGGEVGVVAPLAPAQGQSKLIDDRTRDLILNREDVAELTIEPLGPEGHVGGHIHELHVDAQRPARPEHRSLEHDRRGELLRHVPQIAGAALEVERRGARSDVEAVDDGEVADDFVRQSVRKVLAVGLGAQVLQRQHRDDGTLGWVDRDVSRGRCRRAGAGSVGSSRLPHRRRNDGGEAQGRRRKQRKTPGAERCQVALEIARTGVAPRGLGVDCSLNDAGEPGRHVRTKRSNVGLLAALVRGAERRQVPGHHRIPAGQQVVEQHAETVDIGLDAGCAAVQNLGRQIHGRPRHARARTAYSILASAKVHQDHAPIVGPHHVLRLDVAVEHASAVHSGHGSAQLQADRDGFACGAGPAAGQRLFERTSPHELHPQADAPIDDVSAVNGDDVRVANASQQPAFLDDRGGARAVRRRTDRQQLEGDLAVEFRVPRSVDLAEGPAADRFEHAELTPRLSRPSIVGGRAPRFRKATMEVGERGEDLQRRNEAEVVSAVGGFHRRPVDGGTIEDRSGKIVQPSIRRGHVSFPPPGGPARVVRLSARPRLTVSRAPSPAPRRCSPSRCGR